MLIDHQQLRLAWPHHASDDQLRLLPRTVVSVNELDPLRDEGLLFSRRLRDLGVDGYSRVVEGTTHAADISFQNELKDITAATLDDVAAFAKAVGSVVE